MIAEAFQKIGYPILPSCSIPDDHIDPRRSAFFMARSVFRDVWNEDQGC
jgi:hypothetical protein